MKSTDLTKSSEARKMADVIKEREYFYRLILSQLLYDGLNLPAEILANAVSLDISVIAPSPQLLKSTRPHLQVNKEEKCKLETDFNQLHVTEHDDPDSLDLEFFIKGYTSSASLAQYETLYVTAHKGPCTTASFSHDGQLLATGSHDASIKIIEVERMLLKAAESRAEKGASERLDDREESSTKNHPVIRTLYDHSNTVNCVEFHPAQSILVSAGDDLVINFFDFTKSSVKKAFRVINEVESVCSMSYHPTSDHLLVATLQPTVRLYDVNTSECFVSSNTRDQHLEALTCVKYNPSGSMYVTTCIDGSFKLWDGVSNRCTKTFEASHSGASVVSATFNANGRLLLTCGKDNVSKLWDIRMGHVLINFYGASTVSHLSPPAIFNHTQDYVIHLDETNQQFVSWNCRTGERVTNLATGHSNIVRWLVHSPVESAMVSCSEDFRARFWYSGQM